MDDNKWMRTAFEYAKKGINHNNHQPLNCLLYVINDELSFYWVDDEYHSIEDIDILNNHLQGGVLYFPYEPDLLPKLLAEVIKLSPDEINISQTNRMTPNQFVMWAKENHISVNTGVLEEEGFRLNEIYFHQLTSDYPFITLSFGMSLDGKIATHTGDSKYISGPESLAFVHRLRHQHEAILVGINTVMIDHPSLTTRLKDVNGHNPIKIIMDSTLKIDVNEPLFTSSEAKTIIVTSQKSNLEKKKALLLKGIGIIEIENDQPHLNIREMLLKLKQAGIYSILVEGGGTIHFSFIKERLFNRLYATVSPIIIGGEKAKTAVSGSGFDTLKEAAKLKFIDIHHYGKDLIIEAILDEENN